MEQVERWLAPSFWEHVLQEAVEWAIASLPRLLIIAIGAWVALKAYQLALRRAHTLLNKRANGQSTTEHEKRLNTLMGILRKVGTITLWTIVTMLVLVELGIDIGPLIAGAGVIGLAVGFGAQEFVRDVISGFLNLLEDHVRTGDVVQINGTGGLVENIGLRTIILRDLSGVVHVFQNGKINTIANMTKIWSAMVFDVGVAYKEDTDEVIAVMHEVAEGLRSDTEYALKILEPLEVFGVDAFSDSAVVIKARFKTHPGDQWSVGREYRRRLKHAFDARGIEIPFPHRTLYFANAGAELERHAPQPVPGA